MSTIWCAPLYLKIIISAVVSYLLGSIPTGYLFGKWFFGTDIRKVGSGNTGATNALRTYGVKYGLAVLVIDILKGITAILLTKYIMQRYASLEEINLVVSLAGLVVILGHIYSVFLHFKGGKGVATTAGVFLLLMPMQVVIVLILFIFIVAMTKYISLGSILAAIIFFLIELLSQYIYGFTNLPQLILVLAVSTLIIIKHKANIKRLWEGTENKISFKKKVNK